MCIPTYKVDAAVKLEEIKRKTRSVRIIKKSRTGTKKVVLGANKY